MLQSATKHADAASGLHRWDPVMEDIRCGVQALEDLQLSSSLALVGTRFYPRVYSTPGGGVVDGEGSLCAVPRTLRRAAIDLG